jgi:hypothetical protein
MIAIDINGMHLLNISKLSRTVAAKRWQPCARKQSVQVVHAWFVSSLRLRLLHECE